MRDKWISVKERLPNDSEYVTVAGYQESGDKELLVFYNNAFLSYGNWEDDMGLFDNGEEILFWMPLPEPPIT